MPLAIRPLRRCGVCRSLFIVCLFLIDPSAVYAQGNATSGSDALTTVDEFAKDFARLKQNLADLPRKIENTSEVVSQNTNSTTARQEVDALRATVAGLLSSLADNGALAKLGQTALNHVGRKLSEVQQDTHFPQGQKARLVDEWQRVAKETTTAVADLNNARQELGELLRVLQTNEDFLAALEELRQASETIDAIHKLTNELRDISGRLTEIQRRMMPPSM